MPKTLIIDDAFEMLRRGKYIYKTDKDVLNNYKLESQTTGLMRSHLRKAKTNLFLFDRETNEAAAQLAEDSDLMLRLLPRLRLPFDYVWFENLPSGEDTDSEELDYGVLLSRVPEISETAINISVFFRVNENNAKSFVSYALLRRVFDPLNFINSAFTGRPTINNFINVTTALAARKTGVTSEKRKDFDNEDVIAKMENTLKLFENRKLSTDVTIYTEWHLPNLEQSAKVNLDMHFETCITYYPIKDLDSSNFVRVWRRLSDDIIYGMTEQLHRECHFALAQILLLNMRGRITEVESPARALNNVPHPPKIYNDYIQHNVVTMKLKGKVKDLLDEEERVALGGSRKRRHAVKGHWCVSRKLGSPDCKNVERVCTPKSIDARRNMCQTCEKPEWFRKDMMRGDSSIGFIEKTYIVTE